MGISMLKIRRSHDRLSLNMGIPILVRQHLYIETAPMWFVCKWRVIPEAITLTGNLFLSHPGSLASKDQCYFILQVQCTRPPITPWLSPRHGMELTGMKSAGKRMKWFIYPGRVLFAHNTSFAGVSLWCLWKAGILLRFSQRTVAVNIQYI